MTARANGLVPCDSRSSGFVEDLSDDSPGPDAGGVIISYLDLPGLQVGWGFQIVRFDQRFFLRSVQFRRDWRGGTIEVRPHVFYANPVQPDPLVRTVSLSASLAEKLRAIAMAEIAQADPANGRMGFDGEGLYFYADGKCAWAWSPDEGSDPARLADIFHDLKTQAILPTRLVQIFWEKRIFAKLNKYSGNAFMSIGEYLIVLAIGVGIVAVGGLPLIIAWLLTFFSKGLQSKRRFVVVSGALSYGFTCFVGLLLLPFFLLGSVVSAELDVKGHPGVAFALDVIVKDSVFVMLTAALVFAVAVPVYLGRRWSTSWTLASGAGTTP